ITRMKTDKDGADSRLSTINHQLAGNGEVKESKPADYNFPNSRRTYVAGVLHPDIRVPFREISLAPTKTMSGEIEINEPVRASDTSGPWGDNSASPARTVTLDRKSTRLNSSHVKISYAVFCLKKKKNTTLSKNT